MSYVLGLGGGYHHDASACLVHDGRIVAYAEEERFSRRKHNADSRSCSRAAAFCLDRAGITLSDVDEIAVGWNPYWPAPADVIEDPGLVTELLNPAHFAGYRPVALRILPHHLAHAASAFLCSGFAEAVVLVADGSGDGVSTSLWHGTPRGLRPLAQYPFTQSLGWAYEAVAEHVGLGDWTNAGKLMGLAGYGRPVYDLPGIAVTAGGYQIDLSTYGVPPDEDVDAQYLDLTFYRRFRAAWRDAFTDLGVPATAADLRYDRASGALANHTAFHQHQFDLAASMQHTLERCLLALARTALRQTGAGALCLAGGVALNCSANGVLLRDCGAERLFVQPVAGDGGLAIGGALELARERGELCLPAAPLTDVALGPAFADDLIASRLAANGIAHVRCGDGLPERVADAIAAGKVVGWFQGAAEGGPRALGQRSILGDPRSVALRDHINRFVKRRESWRPLAPSVLGSAMPRMVCDAGPAEFMIVAYRATDAAVGAVPGVVHVDGTLRPQAVPDDGSRYATLLHALDDRIGVPAVLNTSFNQESEPMVCTPVDAIRTFFATSIDLLAIGDCLVVKSDHTGQ